MSQYLEARLVSLAKDAKRCVLENANVPQLPALSEMDTADMEVFLEQMLLICGVLGINFFQKPTGLSKLGQSLPRNPFPPFRLPPKNFAKPCCRRACSLTRRTATEWLRITRSIRLLWP